MKYGLLIPLTLTQAFDPDNKYQIKRYDPNTFCPESGCRKGDDYYYSSSSYSSYSDYTEADFAQPINKDPHEVLPRVDYTHGENCGVSSVDRIVGGSATTFTTHPWQVFYLGEVAETKDQYSCGGSVITSRYVITAAHCVAASKTRKCAIIIGYDDEPPNSIPADRWFDIQYQIVHEDYVTQLDTEGIEDDLKDIAVVQTENEMDLSSGFIQPICLPTPDTCLKEGSEVFISGYGSQKAVRSKREALHDTTLLIEKLDDAEILNGEPYTSDVLAAEGAGERDTCQGDSGGPLSFYDNNGKSWLLGIVSYGQGCAKLNFPGMYVRVSPFLDWISQNTNLDFPSTAASSCRNGPVVSNFGAMEGTDTERVRPPFINSENQIRADLFGDDLCMRSDNLVKYHNEEVTSIASLNFGECTGDLRTEWGYDFDTQQIHAAGYNGVFCLQVHTDNTRIKLGKCNTAKKHQRFQYEGTQILWALNAAESYWLEPRTDKVRLGGIWEPSTPTDPPTASPTEPPTESPIEPTDSPTASPTEPPTESPVEPTESPTASPTDPPAPAHDNIARYEGGVLISKQASRDNLGFISSAEEESDGFCLTANHISRRSAAKFKRCKASEDRQQILLEEVSTGVYLIKLKRVDSTKPKELCLTVELRVEKKGRWQKCKGKMEQKFEFDGVEGQICSAHDGRKCLVFPGYKEVYFTKSRN